MTNLAFNQELAQSFPFDSINYWDALGFTSQSDLEFTIYMGCEKEEYKIVCSDKLGRFVLFNDLVLEKMKLFKEIQQREQPQKHSEFYVYFILNRDQGAVKIGVSKDPCRRVEDLQTGNSSRLILMGYIPGDAKTEKEIHEQFKLNRLSGEWFSISDSLRKFIKHTLKEKCPASPCIPKGF